MVAEPLSRSRLQKLQGRYGGIDAGAGASCRIEDVAIYANGIDREIEKSHARCKAGESERHSVSAWQACLEHSRVKAFAINNIRLST